VAVARRHGVAAWADRVATPRDFALLRLASFERFSGDFFLRPAAIASPAVRAERLGTARTLAAVQAAAGDFDALEHTIATDPGLSIKLLRWANSAASAARSPISTVRAALMRLGASTVGRWAMLVGVAGLSGEGSRVVALTGAGRARTLDLLARRVPGLTSENAFAIGLFSVLDALVDAPMDEVVHEAGLGGDVGAALLHGTGPGGDALRAVVGYERGAPVAGGAMPFTAVASAHARGTLWAEALPWATVG
jgi:EAL and modified HD-GYP domain-containing signal transduction protein